MAHATTGGIEAYASMLDAALFIEGGDEITEHMAIYGTTWGA